MKKTSIILFLFTISFLPVKLFAQKGISQEIISAFDNRSSAVLCNYLDTEAGLQLPGTTGTFSADAACDYICQFFQTNVPQTFQVMHQGTSNESAFLIGKLVTSNGTYRVNVLTREVSGKQRIQQLRIEKSN